MFKKKTIIKLSLLLFITLISSFILYKIIISMRLKKAKENARSAGLIIDKTDALQLLKNLGYPEICSPQTQNLKQALTNFKVKKLSSKFISQQELNDNKLPCKIVWEWKETSNKYWEDYDKNITDDNMLLQMAKHGIIVVNKAELPQIGIESIFLDDNNNYFTTDKKNILKAEFGTNTTDDSLLLTPPDNLTFKYKNTIYDMIYLKENNKYYEFKHIFLTPNNPQSKEDKSELKLFVKYLYDLCSILPSQDFNTPLSKVQLYFLKKLYKQTSKKLDKLVVLTQKQKSSYLLTIQDMTSPFTPVSYLMNMQEYVKTLKQSAIYFAERGDTNKSLEYLLAIKQVNIKLLNADLQIITDIKQRTLQIYKDSVVLYLARQTLSNKQLQQLQINNLKPKLLSQIQNVIKFDTYFADKIVTDTAFSRYGFDDEYNLGENSLKDKLQPKLLRFSGIIDLNWINFYQSRSKNYQIFNYITTNPSTSKKGSPPSSPPSGITNILANIEHCSYQTFANKYFSCIAYQDCLNCGLAMEMYRLKHGAFPKELQELVPEFIAEIPQDPFGNGKLKYLIKDKEVIIYSIGKNQRDDKGRENFDTGKDDISFRLLKTRIITK